MRRLIELNEFEDQSLYLHVTRGVAKRDHAFPKAWRHGVRDEQCAFHAGTEQVERAWELSRHRNRWLRCTSRRSRCCPTCCCGNCGDEGCSKPCCARRHNDRGAARIFSCQERHPAGAAEEPSDASRYPYDVVLEMAQADGIKHEVRPVQESELRHAVRRG